MVVEDAVAVADADAVAEPPSGGAFVRCSSACATPAAPASTTVMSIVASSLRPPSLIAGKLKASYTRTCFDDSDEHRS